VAPPALLSPAGRDRGGTVPGRPDGAHGAPYPSRNCTPRRRLSVRSRFPTRPFVPAWPSS